MILLVDDDAQFVDQAIAALAREHTVCAAPDPQSAIHVLDQFAPALAVALVDLNLGKESGFDLIREVRKMQPALPVIAISGVYSADALEVALIFGASETLSKPLTPAWRSVVEHTQRKRTFLPGAASPDRPNSVGPSMKLDQCKFGHRPSTGHFRCVCGARLTFTPESTSLKRVEDIRREAGAKSGRCPDCGITHVVRLQAN